MCDAAVMEPSNARGRWHPTCVTTHIRTPSTQARRQLHALDEDTGCGAHIFFPAVTVCTVPGNSDRIRHVCWRHSSLDAMQSTSISSSTQFTVHHHEQRSASVFALDANRDVHGLLKNVESVYMQSMSHQDQLKRHEREQRQTDERTRRLHEELRSLRSQLTEQEHVRNQDSTIKEELMTSKTLIDGIMSTQGELKAMGRRHQSLVGTLKSRAQRHRKFVEELRGKFNGIIDKQKERRELKDKKAQLQQQARLHHEKLAAMQWRVQELQQALESSEAHENETQEKLEATVKQVVQLDSKITAMATQHAGSLEQLGQQLEAVETALTTELTLLEAQAIEAQRLRQEECSKLGAELDTARNEMINATAEHKTASSETSEQMESMRSKCNDQAEELEALRSQLQQQSKEKQCLELKCEELQSSLESACTYRDELKAAAATEASLRDQLETAAAATMEDVARLRARVETCAEAQEQATAAREALEAQLDDAKKVAKTEHEAAQSSHLIQVLNMRAERDDKEKELRQARVEINALAQQHEKSRKKLIATKAELVHQEEEGERMRQRIEGFLAERAEREEERIQLVREQRRRERLSAPERSSVESSVAREEEEKNRAWRLQIEPPVAQTAPPLQIKPAQPLPGIASRRRRGALSSPKQQVVVEPQVEPPPDSQIENKAPRLLRANVFGSKHSKSRASPHISDESVRHKKAHKPAPRAPSARKSSDLFDELF